MQQAILNLLSTDGYQAPCFVTADSVIYYRHILARRYNSLIRGLGEFLKAMADTDSGKFRSEKERKYIAARFDVGHVIGRISRDIQKHVQRVE